MRGKLDQRVAIYCRNAYKDPAKMIEQKEQLTQLAKSLGYTQFTYYIDDGASGLNCHRPGFHRLEQDINAGVIDVVIVRDAARIVRDCLQVTAWIERLVERGIKFLNTVEYYTGPNTV